MRKRRRFRMDVTLDGKGDIRAEPFFLRVVGALWLGGCRPFSARRWVCRSPRHRRPGDACIRLTESVAVDFAVLRTGP